MKSKHYTYGSIVFLALILLVGIINKKEIPLIMKWSDRALVWSDFQPVNKISGDFDAAIYSEMYYPSTINKEDALVYAYMDPLYSKKMQDSVLGDQLLKHEQYHFNITEYYARLLRKAIVNQGQEGADRSTLKELYLSYEEERDAMQNEYDEVSEHNLDQPKQLYWQLKIDDLLRQTAYYKNPDIYSYYNFTKEDTEYYKHLYFTMNHQLLTSYPTNKGDSNHGECYQVIRNDNEITVKFYKNGVLTNGGRFDTAITKIKKISDTLVEVHYLDPNEKFNASLDRCISKTIYQNQDRTVTYFDQNQQAVSYFGAHSVFWKWEPNTQTLYSTYYDLDGKKVRNKEQIHHKRRSFDEEGRSIKIEMFNDQHQPIPDNEYISIYQYEFDEHHKVIRSQVYNSDGEFAIHKDNYNTQFDYDERGNMIRYKNMDKNNAKLDDDSGIAIYTYTYDINDNVTSTKRYNAAELPTLGQEDYFMEVTDFDHKNRLIFKAKYYRDYVLAFDDKKNGASQYEYINDSIYKVYNVENYGNVFENNENIAVFKRELDQKGQIIKEVYLGQEECYVKYDDNIAMYSYTYDDRGNKIAETALDSLGQPVKIYGDATTMKWEYNQHDKITKTGYYDVEGEPTALYGPTFTTYTYDDAQNMIGISSYDHNFKPMSYSGSFTEKYIKNKHHKDSIIAYYNTNNRLIKGACYLKKKYNNFGNVIEEAYFNAKNQRVNTSEGISIIRHNYNDHQKYLGYQQYNRFGKPTNDTDGVFEEKRILDTSGYVKSYAYYDKNNTPVLGPSGYHKITYERDDAYITTRQSIYDIHGDLMNNENGIAEYVYTNASSGLTKSIRYLDANRQMVEDSDGVAEIIYLPEMNGLYFTDKKLNAKGEEILDQTDELVEQEIIDEALEEEIQDQEVTEETE